jgi:hypothetical protein
MDNPRKANLMTTEEVKSLGWAGEARDSDGHLHSMTALTPDDEDLSRWVSEAVGDGLTVTFFPRPKGSAMLAARAKGDG